jgi:hypothetical protein
VPTAVKIQGNRQLQRIERPQALSGSVLSRSFRASTDSNSTIDEREISDREAAVRRFDRCNRSRPPDETTSQRACVDKILSYSAFFAEIDDGFGKRTGDGGECASHFVERDVIVKRVDPFLGREVTGDILSGIHGRYSFTVNCCLSSSGWASRGWSTPSLNRA